MGCARTTAAARREQTTMRRIGIRIGAVAAVLGLAAYGATDLATGSSGTHGQIVAACTDTASDAATINNAIAGSAQGAVLLIQGTCLLTSPIKLLGNRTYTGGQSGGQTDATKPTGTVLVQGGPMGYVLASDAYVSTSTPVSSGDPLAIRDLTVLCNGTGSTNGIVVMSWLADVEHVYVSGCGGSGIVDTNANATGTITNTSVNSRFDDNFIENSGKYGFYVQDSGNSITDGFFRDNQVSGSHIDGVHLENGAGWVVSGNHLYGDGQDGIYVHRMFGTTIADNYVEDFASAQTSGSYYGIEADVQGDVASTVSGNKVFNDGAAESATASHTYIALTQVGYGIGNVAVTGNVVVGRQSSDVGLSFTGGGNPLQVSSTGNRVSGVGTARSLGANATVDSGV
jgi:parallel beta-helix repeat protein